jgi:hypothetical protein
MGKGSKIQSQFPFAWCMLDSLFNIVFRPDYTSLSAYQSDTSNLNLERARRQSHGKASTAIITG